MSDRAQPRAAAGPLPALAIVRRVSARRWAVAIALSAVAVVVLARPLDTSRVRAAFEVLPGEPAAIVLMVGAYTAAFYLRAVAWRRLLAAPVSTARLFVILQASLVLNHLLPFKAGDLARAGLAIRRGVEPAEAISTTLVARLLDVAALASIAAVSLLVLNAPAEADAGVGTIAGRVAFVLVLALAALAFVRRGRLEAWLPARLRAPVASLETAVRGLSLRAMVVVAPLVAASWVLEGAVLLGAAQLLQLEVSPSLAVGATAFTVLAQVVHVTPGGVGMYEAAMTSVLVAAGLPAGDALALAVLTHALKFAYSFTLAPAFAAPEVVPGLWDRRARGRRLPWVRSRAGEAPRAAPRLEVIAARAWNVLNEGKPFTLVFTLGVIVLLEAPRALERGPSLEPVLAILAVTPLALVYWRYEFPLRLRAALWAYLVAFLALTGAFEVAPVLLVAGLYLLFTVVLWGSVYYHLRIGTPFRNGFRFARLVFENPDPTSGNMLEQLPKVLLLVLAVEHLAATGSALEVVRFEAFTVVIAASAVLIHQWWFTWVPALPQPGLAEAAPAPPRSSRRVIVIAIDGCRADRLREARTPFLDRLRAEGLDYTNVATVYPARTVTCFSSMLTGAAPEVHGMRSNFVPSLGVKCESVFDVLRARGMRGALVGIAHLIDAFGEEDVRSVSAVADNDAIDAALVARAQRVLIDEDPDLLVLQLLAVDQTGHARGSYNAEYLARIEETDRTIEGFLGWCREAGYLEGATVIVTADHGQGIGIGGHGHMTPSEITIPCIAWGAGVEAPRASEELRFITDLAPTITDALGVRAPASSVGRSLWPRPPEAAPLVFVIPAHNEAESLPGVLERIAAHAPHPHVVVVVDDGSTDATAELATRHGATVIRHAHNRGLGAALRTGLAAARDMSPRAVVYLDADGEYDPAEVARLLAPIQAGDADYVLGSRFLGRIEGMRLRTRVANRGFTALLSLLAGRRISDGQTGYRAFSRRAADVAEIVHDYNYAQVLTLDLLHKGMRLREVPITYRRRRHGRSFISRRYLWRVPLGMAREVLRG